MKNAAKRPPKSKRPAHHATYNAGADDCRNLWMRKIRRMLKENPKQRRGEALNELIDFGWSMAERAKEKAGGL
jgi:hypothetical protein